MSQIEKGDDLVEVALGELRVFSVQQSADESLKLNAVVGELETNETLFLVHHKTGSKTSLYNKLCQSVYLLCFFIHISKAILLIKAMRPNNQELSHAARDFHQPETRSEN